MLVMCDLMLRCYQSRAADLGMAAAQFNFGAMLAIGKGVPKVALPPPLPPLQPSAGTSATRLPT